MNSLWLRVLLSLMCGLFVGYAAAAPHINWGDMLLLPAHDHKNTGVTVDLRPRWESTIVGGVQLPNRIAYEPDQVWQWPGERFSTNALHSAVRLHKGDRMVTRMTIFSEKIGMDFTLSVRQPRLDSVHVSYRYDNGPWTTVSSGDTIAMDNWAQPDRQPSFNLPMLAGQMDMVVQISHRGILEMPVVLQNTRAFLHDRTTSIWVAGMMVGVSLVMALMGLMMALNYQRISFLSVTVMSTMMALVLIFGSGLGGMFFGTHSATFNDEIKFYVNTNWTTMLPLVAALALGLRHAHRMFWGAAIVVAVLGWVMTLVWMDYAFRDTAPVGVPILLGIVLLLTLTMMAWAWYRDVCRNWVLMVGLTLQIMTPVLPFLSYLGLIQTDDAGQSAALLSLLAGICFLRGLFLQHRMGRQVMARANMSPMRDVLTGLLNRAGMQAQLYKVKGRIKSELSSAIFIYVELLSEQDAMEMHGEEGFEMGLVQVAASLSSTVSGVDGLARVSRNAFVITVMMPPDHAVATRVAQKILSRLMALSSHGAPLAASARLSLSWLPLYGFRLDRLEQRSIRTLRALPENKRIGWVGGPASHAEANQLLSDMRNGQDMPRPSAVEDGDNGDYLLVSPKLDVSSNIYERIHRIEREMLQGVDTNFLVAEAERMSRAINEANSAVNSTQSPPVDEQPTQLLFPSPVKPA